MTTNRQYGFIGFGNVAKAIVHGLKDDTSISFAYFSQTNRHKEIEAKDSLQTLVACSDVIVLCIKPQELGSVLSQLQSLDLKGKVLLSPVAGKSTAFIQRFVGGETSIVRIMPNLAVAYKKSVTSFYATSDNPLTLRVKADMQQLGKVVDLNESDFDLFTAIFGSGPAFLLEILASMKAKILELDGVPLDSIDDLLLELTLGTATYLQQNHHQKNLAELIDNITSKGGTTEAGLRYFRKQQLGDLFGKVMDAAKNRSAEIGKMGDQ